MIFELSRGKSHMKSRINKHALYYFLVDIANARWSLIVSSEELSGKRWHEKSLPATETFFYTRE